MPRRKFIDWRLKPMRDAINDIELAAGPFTDIARMWEGAGNNIAVNVPLHAVRRIAACYPALNAIMNDPRFNLENS